MKILTTVSAVVFLMILTASLATAKKPVLTFPFTGTGDVFFVDAFGAEGGPFPANITVNRTSNGLFYGTIVYDSPPATIDFAAVRDSSGGYTLNGVIVPVATPPLIIQGTLVISLQKPPGLKTKVYAAAIQFWVLNGDTFSFAGILYQ